MRTALGLILFLSIAGAFLILSGRAFERSDLSVRLDRPPGLPLITRGALTLSGRIAPPDLRRRVTLDLDGAPLPLLIDPASGAFEVAPPGAGPGLHYLRWTATYGGRWRRQAGVTFLEGPFARSGKPRCGARVLAAQRLLDDGLPNSGEDLATALQPAILTRINRELERRGLPRARSFILRLKLVSGGLFVEGRIDLGAAGSLRIHTTTTFDLKGGRLSPWLVAPITAHVDDRLRATITRRTLGDWGSWGNWLIDLFLSGMVKKETRDRLVSWVRRTLLPRIGHMLRPRTFTVTRGARVTVGFCSAPRVVRGHLEAGLAIDLRSPAGGSSPAAPVFPGPGPVRPALPGKARLAVFVSPGTINLLLHAWWGSGAMARAIQESGALARVNRSLAMLAVRVDRAAPALPPTIQPRRRGDTHDLDLRAGELLLTLTPRTGRGGGPELVALYGALGIRARYRPGDRHAAVKAELRELSMSCLEDDGARPETCEDTSGRACLGASQRRRPCYGDLAEMALSSFGDHGAGAVLSLELELDWLLRRMQTATRRAGLKLSAGALVTRIAPGTPPWFGIVLE